MLELSKEDRQQAITSIQRYFEQNMEEKIGNVAASGLLGFFLEEIGPTVYNKGVADAQERVQARVAELDFEVHEEEFSGSPEFRVGSLAAYFSPSWTPFQADRGRRFSVIVDGVSD